MITNFQKFMIDQSTAVSTEAFIVNLVLAGLLSMLLGAVYVRYGNSFSNRRQLAGNFVILSMTTMIIITIVKSSLALSLGLVGALSIVRFRAAIKDPEELTYLFLTIAIGLGLGANQTLITIVGFVMVVGVIYILYKRKSGTVIPDTVLNIRIENETNSNETKLIDILKDNCTKINLRRYDSMDSITEASFHIEVENFNTLMNVKNALKDEFKTAHISFLDNKGIV